MQPSSRATDAKRESGHRREAKVWARALGRLVWMLAATLATAELLVRFVPIHAMPLQIVRSTDARPIRLVEGVPIWPGPEEGTECIARHPAAPRVAFYGDSIFAGSGVDLERTFAALLRARFASERIDVCIVNHASPGFGFTSKRATARTTIPTEHPNLVYWELWGNDVADYTMRDGAAYNFTRIPLDEAGYPNAFDWPPTVNRALFRTSRLYWTIDLLVVPHDAYDASAMHLYDRDVPAAIEEILRSGAKTVLVPCPPLDVPFARSIARRDDWEEALRPWAESHSVPILELERALVREDYRAIRLDPCCHYNARGHARLAEIFYEDIVARLDLRRGDR